MASYTQGIIWPATKYGTLKDIYGTNIPAYANTGGFPQGCGLILGEFGLLFDATQVRLLKVAGTVNSNDCVVAQTGNSNDYTVMQSSTTNQPILAIQDRSGAQLTAGGIAWMTQRGNATANVLGSINAPAFLVSSGTAGYLQQASAGTSLQSNIYLENNTTAQGAYPVIVT